jgi:hypothetical protein
VKTRLWGTENERQLAAERLTATLGLIALPVCRPYADHGASVLVRVFIEARPGPPPVHVAGSAEPRPRSQHKRAV